MLMQHSMKYFAPISPRPCKLIAIPMDAANGCQKVLMRHIKNNMKYSEK
jgi:alkylhydroperoxidase/carboxymuconolactone decarboxylase family protein YurZ